jgi:secreted PhoX family phosphatase
VKKFRALALGGIVAGALAAVAVAASDVKTGPSSSESPYVVPVAAMPSGVATRSILTAGDTPTGSSYKLVGIPDGLGAFDNGDGTFTLLVNHEIPSANGVARAHGGTGAFVSKWVIDKDDLEVKSGSDLVQQVYTYSAGSYSLSAATQFNRLCSADLPSEAAFFNAASGKGYDGRIYMNGEESGAEGRGFAHVVTGPEAGKSYQLPYLGRFSWENSLAHPSPGDKTVVIGTDDSGDGQIYVYVGDKASSGSAIDRAGLGGGTLYGVKVDGLTQETDASSVAANTPFTLASLGDVSGKTGAQLEIESDLAGVTGFNRPEDGVWDPTNPNVFYFVSTASINGKSRLWKLTFVDATNPALGGTVTPLLDGTEGHHMLDNMTVDDSGHVFLQEDPGSNNPAGTTNYLAKVWVYDVATDKLVLIAEHDAARFTPGEPGFLTTDEESSGIIPAPFLGQGWYLLDVQAHYPIAGELFQGGQLLALHIPPAKLAEILG